MKDALESFGVFDGFEMCAPGDGTLLGLELVGRKNIWRPSRRRVWRITRALQHMVRRGFACMGQELEKVVGHLSSVLALRKELICLPHAAYQYINKS